MCENDEVNVSIYLTWDDIMDANNVNNRDVIN